MSTDPTASGGGTNSAPSAALSLSDLIINDVDAPGALWRFINTWSADRNNIRQDVVAHLIGVIRLALTNRSNAVITLYFSCGDGLPCLTEGEGPDNIVVQSLAWATGSAKDLLPLRRELRAIPGIQTVDDWTQGAMELLPLVITAKSIRLGGAKVWDSPI